MNHYVNLINDIIGYIEGNISERMALEDISRQFCVSEFHFNRMFKTVVGKTLKQYILGRKLTRSLENLKNTGESIIDIAYDYGFAYPEVFSRAFKKQFGVSPAVYRKEKAEVAHVNIACVVERDIVSFQGLLTLKGTFVYLEELCLEGASVEVNVNRISFEPLLKSAGDHFLLEAQKAGGFKDDRFYTVVNCHGEDNGEYTVFFGMEPAPGERKIKFQNRLVPSGWYASFSYHGDMFDIRETFSDDLYRWIMVKEVEINPNGVGMLNIYEKDYPETLDVKILVPVKNPV